jgi:hypothetical protein
LTSFFPKPSRASSRSVCDSTARIFTCHNENLVSQSNNGRSYFTDDMSTSNLITNALIPLVIDRQEEQKNKEDQTNHKDTRILTWKTLQCEGKNYGHQPVTTFTIFVECLQERRDMFRRLIRGLYSKTLIHTTGLRPRTPRRPQSGPKANWPRFAPVTSLRFAHQLDHL